MRTCLILGGLALAIVNLLAWVGIALLSWLWALAPVAAETGKRLADEVGCKTTPRSTQLRVACIASFPFVMDGNRRGHH